MIKQIKITTSLKSCLLRIPNSINSKYNTKVKVVHKWDRCRPSIKLLIGDFFAYLVDLKIRKQRKLKKKSSNNIQTNTNTVPWIEKLLETPIEEGRKYTLWRILCPYLVNIKN